MTYYYILYQHNRQFLRCDDVLSFTHALRNVTEGDVNIIAEAITPSGYLSAKQIGELISLYEDMMAMQDCRLIEHIEEMLCRPKSTSAE